MIFGHGFQRVHGATRHGAEIRRAGQDARPGDDVQESVEQSRGPFFERAELRVLRPLRLHDVVALRAQVEHLSDHFGRMLAVGIQRNHHVAARGVQPGGQRGLVPKVAAERNHAYALIGLRQRGQLFGGRVGGAVVHVNKCERVRQAVNRGADAGVHLRDDARFVENRDDKINFQFIAWGHSAS